MPHDGFSAFVDSQGHFVQASLYNPADWEKYGWSVFDPKRRKKLQRVLTARMGKAAGVKAYDEQVALERAFLEKALHRARRFQEALRKGDPREEASRVQYVVMGADCQPTPFRAQLSLRRGAWQTFFKAPNPRMRAVLFGLGDGSVTKESLLGYYPIDGVQNSYRLPDAHGMFFCEGHGDLTKNVIFLDNVLHTMLEE